MGGKQLFQGTPNDTHIDIVLGEWPCDVPFGGGEIEHVSVTKTLPKNLMPLLNLTEYRGFSSNQETSL